MNKHGEVLEDDKMQEYKHLFWSCLLFKIFVFQTNKLNWLTSFVLYLSLFAVIMSLVLKKEFLRGEGWENGLSVVVAFMKKSFLIFQRILDSTWIHYV